MFLALFQCLSTLIPWLWRSEPGHEAVHLLEPATTKGHSCERLTERRQSTAAVPSAPPPGARSPSPQVQPRRAAPGGGRSGPSQPGPAGHGPVPLLPSPARSRGRSRARASLGACAPQPERSPGGLFCNCCFYFTNIRTWTPPARLCHSSRTRRPCDLGSRSGAERQWPPSRPAAAPRALGGSPSPAPATGGGTRPGSARRSCGGSPQAERLRGAQGQRLPQPGPAGATHGSQRSRGRAAAAAAPTERRTPRQGAAWPRRGRRSSPGAVCALPGEGRAGAGPRAGGRAGAGRGEVRSSLSSFSRCFWAGWAAKRCCGRKGRRASGEMSVLHQVPHRWHPSGARSVCEHLWERGEIQGRRLRTVLTAGAVGRSVFQIPFNICQQSLNCVDLSSLLINIHLANTRVHCTRLPELPLLGPCVLLTVTQPPVVASEVTSANAVEASWNFSMYFQNCETDYKGDREKWKGITVFSYFNFFLSISNIKVMLGIYFSKDIC